MVHEMFPEHQEELNVLSESFKGEQMKFFVFFFCRFCKTRLQKLKEHHTLLHERILL